MSSMKSFLLASLLLMAGKAGAIEPPTMGWSSWNTFALNISETIIKNQANAMASKGFVKAGYIYCNIDDGYFGGRDEETGQLLIHKTRFPNGLKPVVDYIHSKGMKAGIYSDGGPTTCGYYHGGDKTGNGVGLYQHDQQDCDFFFKELEFDFIKVDFCGGDPIHNDRNLDLNEQERYTAINKAIENTGREGVRMNICRWAHPGTWALDLNHVCSWRTTGDINSSWESVSNIIKENLYLSAYCRNGHYNDMDMLEVGVSTWAGKLTDEECKTHFGMWCLMSSPLLIGCNVADLSSTASTLLRNKELIAINQDSLGLQAYVVAQENGTYTLVKDFGELNGLTRVCGIYNPTEEKQVVTLKFSDLCMGGDVSLRDLFKHKELGVFQDSYEVTVPKHGLMLYQVTATERLERTLYEAETAYMQGYTEIEWGRPTYEDNAACSGGKMASWLGKNAKYDIVWDNVYSKDGGDYYLNTFYLSGESRSMTLEVNGKKIVSISAANQGWGKVQKNRRKITLQPGNNIIRLYNSTAYMPNIDCITLEKVIPTAIEKVKDGSDKASSREYTLSGVPSDKGKNTPGVYVKKGRKVVRK